MPRKMTDWERGMAIVDDEIGDGGLGPWSLADVVIAVFLVAAVVGLVYMCIWIGTAIGT